MKEVFKLHAEVCKALASAKRLEIIYALKDGEMSAGGIARSLGITKANVSQHLSILRSCGVVRGRRDGVSIYYSISNPKIVKACALMRDVMEEMLKEKQGLLRRFKKGR